MWSQKSQESKNKINKIKEIEKMVDREKLYYKTNKFTYNFQNFQTISTFVRYLSWYNYCKRSW